MKHNTLLAKNIAILKRAMNIDHARVSLYIECKTFFIEVDARHTAIRFDLDSVPNNIPDGRYEVVDNMAFKRLLSPKNQLGVILDDITGDFKITVGNYRIECYSRNKDFIPVFDTARFTDKATDISGILEGMNAVYPSILKDPRDKRDFLRCIYAPQNSGMLVATDGHKVAAFDTKTNLDASLNINPAMIDMAGNLNYKAGESVLIVSENKHFLRYQDYVARYTIVSKTLDVVYPVAVLDLAERELDIIGRFDGAELHAHLKDANKVSKTCMLAKYNGTGSTSIMTAPSTVEYEAILMDDTKPHDPIVMPIDSILEGSNYIKDKTGITFGMGKNVNQKIASVSWGDFKLIFASFAPDEKKLLSKPGLYTSTD